MKKKILLEYLILFILGGLTSISLPPYNFFLISFFSFSFFFGFLFKKLEIHTSRKISFFYGWFFGFGYFSTNLYWIAISLTFDKNLSFLIPISLILIPSFIALFYGFISYTFLSIKPKNVLSAFFLFSLLCGIFEFVKSIILTGFPWNLIVYSFSTSLNFINIISIIGTYSLNLIVVSFFTAPALYILRKSKKEIGVCIVLILLPILFLTYGSFKKQEFLSKKIQEIPFKIRVIGSNISLDRFYGNFQTEHVINELISISSPEKDKRTFFLWPEGIVPNTYLDELYLYKDIFSKNFNEKHIIGLGITSREKAQSENRYYNSLSILDNNLNLIENYNKIKLVPFGEFIPFEDFFRKIGLKTITSNVGSFTKGNQRNVILLQGHFSKVKFLPLICYEIIYSGNLSNNSDYDYILNISEDGWFGDSIGPKQHFAHSVFRSIESGKYIIRSANNGMAAIVNPLGEIEKKIDYGLSGYIDFEKKRNMNETIFSTYGNKIFLALILLYIFLTFSFNRVTNE